MEKKYILTKETTQIRNIFLHRIQAVKDFSNVHTGDLGGFIESEKNLSHLDDCWVYNDAMIFDQAFIFGNAKIKENACIRGKAMITDNSIVEGQSDIYDKAIVRDYAKITGCAAVYGLATIFGEATINDDAKISQNVKIGGNAIIARYPTITGNARILQNGYIKDNQDYICIGPIGSRNAYLTFYRTKTSEIYVTTGCFCGSLDMFRRAVLKVHCKGSVFRKEYLEIAKFAKNTYFK